MDTLFKNLFVSLDNHLNCYECMFLTGTHATKTKWAMYFYKDNKGNHYRDINGDHFVSLFHDPDDELMKFLDEVKLNGQKLEPNNISRLALIIGDIELDKKSGNIYSRKFPDLHKFIIKAIDKQQTEIVFQYHCTKPISIYDYVRDYNDINPDFIERILTACKTKNKLIINHIVKFPTPNYADGLLGAIRAHEYEMDLMMNILFVALADNNIERFKALYEQNIEIPEYGILYTFLIAAIFMDNKDLYKFIVESMGVGSDDMLERCLEYAMKLKRDDMIELILSDIKSIPNYFRNLNKSYLCGCSKIFYKSLESNTSTINDLFIFNSPMDNVDIELFKFVLKHRSPSPLQIEILMTNAKTAHRFDLYCYLCTLKATTI